VARNLGYKVVERPVDKSELLIADEAFLSGTAAKITPIKQIENYHLPLEKPITHQLKEKITAITENREAEYQDWVFKISL
jgi:branched-chain amino acid aminotransferase